MSNGSTNRSHHADSATGTSNATPWSDSNQPPVDLPLTQHAIDSLPRESWDVIIVGAGPAGATAATCLAERGHRVLLLDRRAFPREKVCGDGLIADSQRVLERLGLIDTVRRIGHTTRTLSAFSPSGIRVDVGGEFITLKREALDALLVRRAVQAGATFARADISDIHTGEHDRVRVIAAGVDQPFRATLGLLATGADLGLSSRLARIERTAPTGIALRCYVTSPAKIDALVLAYDRAFLPGYAWIFPLGNDEYNVGCGTFFRNAAHIEVNLREMFQQFVQRFELARTLMHSASNVTPLKGAPLRAGLQGAHPCLAPRWLAIGETIGTTFPFTGEGIGKAMETAEIAAEFVHDALQGGDLAALRGFPARIESELSDKYIGYRMAERWLAHAWLTNFLAHRAQQSARIRRAVEGLLNERIDPRRVFSIGGLLRSFRN